MKTDDLLWWPQTQKANRKSSSIQTCFCIWRTRSSCFSGADTRVRTSQCLNCMKKWKRRERGKTTTTTTRPRWSSSHRATRCRSPPSPMLPWSWFLHLLGLYLLVYFLYLRRRWGAKDSYDKEICAAQWLLKENNDGRRKERKERQGRQEGQREKVKEG